MTTYENGDPIITIMPIAVIMDHRLTLIQMRVLAAIFSYRNKDSGVAAVKRETLSQRCGYAPMTISKATSELVALGWLVKSGKGGFSKATEFRVTVPDPATVADPETVAEVDPTTVADPATRMVADPATRKEQSSSTKKEQSNTPKFSATKFLRSLGAEKNLIDEWLTVRKLKKLANTQTAFEDFANEVTKSGKPINDVLSQCVKKSWGGFKASWKWEVPEYGNQKQEQVRQRRVFQ